MNCVRGPKEFWAFMESNIPKRMTPQRSGYFGGLALIVAGLYLHCDEKEIAPVMTDALLGVYNRFASILPEISELIFGS